MTKLGFQIERTPVIINKIPIISHIDRLNNRIIFTIHSYIRIELPNSDKRYYKHILFSQKEQGQKPLFFLFSVLVTNNDIHHISYITKKKKSPFALINILPQDGKEKDKQHRSQHNS